MDELAGLALPQHEHRLDGTVPTVETLADVNDVGASRNRHSQSETTKTLLMQQEICSSGGIPISSNGKKQHIAISLQSSCRQ